MLCKYEPTDQVQGTRRLWRCARKGCFTKPEIWVPIGNRIHPNECTGIPLSHEWGYWLAMALASIGITKPRYAWLLKKPACQTCNDREEKLNKIGHMLHG